MRLAILISLAMLGVGQTAVPVDSSLIPCEVGTHGGYLVPVAYAEAHRADIVATLADGPEVDGFWKVSEQAAIVADRNLREALEDAVKDPTLLFPDLATGSDTTLRDSLEFQRTELKETLDHFGGYQRQYVGIVIDGRRYVLLNYMIGPQLDPGAGFIFIHRTFQAGRMHFLQCRFDWEYRQISHVSFYGTWQAVAK